MLLRRLLHQVQDDRRHNRRDRLLARRLRLRLRLRLHGAAQRDTISGRRQRQLTQLRAPTRSGVSTHRTGVSSTAHLSSST